MRVMPDFVKKVALNVMCILIVKNIRIKPTKNPAAYQVKNAQPTGIQSGLDLTTTMKNLLKVRIVMQTWHQQHQISTQNQKPILQTVKQNSQPQVTFLQ